MIIAPADKDWLQGNGRNLERARNSHWYCIRTLPFAEPVVARWLAHAAQAWFLPIVPAHDGGHIEPLWQGYLYARLDQKNAVTLSRHDQVDRLLIPHDEKALLAELTDIAAALHPARDSASRFLITRGLFAGATAELQQPSSQAADVELHMRFKKEPLQLTVGHESLRAVATPLTDHSNPRDALDKEPVTGFVDRAVLLAATHTFNAELVSYLANHPDLVYSLAPRQFEQLVADVLHDMGYEVQITPESRDGGRDILALFHLPHGPILTLVECKRWAPDRPVGIDVVQRFLWVVEHQDRANAGLIATTSYFSRVARELERQYSYRLRLEDFTGLQGWLGRFGRWRQTTRGGVWTPSQDRDT